MLNILHCVNYILNKLLKFARKYVNMLSDILTSNCLFCIDHEHGENLNIFILFELPQLKSGEKLQKVCLTSISEDRYIIPVQTGFRLKQIIILRNIAYDMYARTLMYYILTYIANFKPENHAR
jgi:hypothetical protein